MLHDRVDCWLNNLIEKDIELYHPSIRNKCMLLPTYIEASNDNYYEFINDQKNIIPFTEKSNIFYFSGAITGCIPAVDCRVNSIIKLLQSKLPSKIRVNGTDNAPFLKYFYDHYLDASVKSPHIDRRTFLDEINNVKFILSPKGNCQPLRRQYEAFAFNNLVFINENNTVDYLFEGIPDKHFVSYKLDCSDLKNKCHYYFNNHVESQKIADAGTEFWKENCRIYKNGALSSNIESYLMTRFYDICNIKI